MMLTVFGDSYHACLDLEINATHPQRPSCCYKLKYPRSMHGDGVSANLVRKTRTQHYFRTLWVTCHRHVHKGAGLQGQLRCISDPLSMEGIMRFGLSSPLQPSLCGRAPHLSLWVIHRCSVLDRRSLLCGNWRPDISCVYANLKNPINWWENQRPSGTSTSYFIALLHSLTRPPSHPN
jgi:hypothetical protein